MAFEVVTLHAWLVRKSGQRRLIREGVTRVGRAPDNDVIVDDAATVSLHHLEIRKEQDAYKVRDLNSTNGTFVNGERITERALDPSDSIQFGATGPEFTFLIDDTAAPEADANRTLIAPSPELPPPAQEQDANSSHEELLSQAIAQARLARHRGLSNQTLGIMRDMLNSALSRTQRKFKTIVAALVLALVIMSGWGFRKIAELRAEKRRIDTQIASIESSLEKAGLSASESEELAGRLDQYESQAKALETKLLYRVAPKQAQDPAQAEIVRLMAEFGAETYSVPPEFLEQVKRFVAQYQGSDRPHMEAALGRSKQDVATIRRILAEANLPPDLAYMALVESAIGSGNKSSAGAAGVWQFTPATAKAYGLAVGGGVDERLDIRKSTQAACRLLRDLILDFGAGSSVMLALAAYNSGSAKVKQGIHKVNDPIKQRNFWYLYRVRALPVETRQYVPKVIAAMIIARNPEKFGF